MPLRACCLAGSTPEGIPAGKVCDLAGVPCYVADSKAQISDQLQPAIVMAPDVFGLSQHCKLLADEINLRSGFPVVLVDYFRSTSLPSSIADRLLPFVSRPSGQPGPPLLQKLLMVPFVFFKVLPVLLPFIFRHMRKKMVEAKFSMVVGVANVLRDGASASLRRRPLGIVGYCYGGKFALHFGCIETIEERVFDAVAVAHGEVKLDQVKALKTSALFVCAENDWAFPEDRIAQAEVILRGRSDYSDSKFRVKRYPGTYHGFAIRGDERNPAVQEAKAAALSDSIDFFAASLVQSKL